MRYVELGIAVVAFAASGLALFQRDGRTGAAAWLAVAGLACNLIWIIRLA